MGGEQSLNLPEFHEIDATVVAAAASAGADVVTTARFFFVADSFRSLRSALENDSTFRLLLIIIIIINFYCLSAGGLQVTET